MSTVSLESLNSVHKKALTYMGPVRDNVRMVAIEILLAAQNAGHNIKVVWGYNAASRPEHSAGTALDFMVYNDKAAGDFVANYAWSNRSRLGLRWQIWRQRIRSASPGKPGTWQKMANRGSGTANHMDHPHMNFKVMGYTPPSGGSAPSKPASTPTAKPTTAKKSNSQIADEVVAGKWGNGADRVKRLAKAGYNAKTIQAEVNRRLTKKPASNRYRVVTKSLPLNGRAGPGQNYKVTMTAARNHVLTIVETRNGWAKSTGGHWYSMEYLKRV